METQNLELGKCPACGEFGTLQYEAMRIEGNAVYYPAECTCGWSGKEWYNINFTEYTTD